jgi:hypothetical protein
MDTTVEKRTIPRRGNGFGEAPSSLAELAALDGETLRRLYETARAPKLAEVAGDLRGRMLAVVVLPPSLFEPVRKLAGQGWFPWRGKSFTALDKDKGEGWNRLFTDRFKRFRFETFVGPSRAGGFDALQLDYDLPENPFFIRAIKDEIRELRPGLWLGQAYLNLGAQPKLVLYFALQQN